MDKPVITRENLLEAIKVLREPEHYEFVKCKECMLTGHCFGEIVFENASERNNEDSENNGCILGRKREK